MSKRLSVLAFLLLASCTRLPPDDAEYFRNLPLNADGLPPHFARCVDNAALKHAQVYDIFYPCRAALIRYATLEPGLDQPAKATLLEELEKRGMSYAHNVAIERHGQKALPPISAPPPTEPAREPVPVIVFPPVREEKPDIRM